VAGRKKSGNSGRRIDAKVSARLASNACGEKRRDALQCFDQREGRLERKQRDGRGMAFVLAARKGWLKGRNTNLYTGGKEGGRERGGQNRNVARKSSKSITSHLNIRARLETAGASRKNHKKNAPPLDN